MFPKKSVIYEIVKKYCRARQAADRNMARVHCMLDTCLQTHSQNM